jgi:drug/metabolite transporter (DMT)-like permease
MSRVVVVLLLSVLTNTVSQLSLKRGLDGLHFATVGPDRGGRILRATTNPFLLVWLVLTVASTALWLTAISRTELSFAYPFLSLNVVLITAGSAVFLKERVTARHWAAVLLIVLGIVLVARS